MKALPPRDLETFFRYERQQEEASVQQLLDWHKELTDALQYAVDNNWLKVCMKGTAYKAIVLFSMPLYKKLDMKNHKSRTIICPSIIGRYL